MRRIVAICAKITSAKPKCRLREALFGIGTGIVSYRV